MTFFNRDTSAAKIEQAEQELNAALENERPDELGAKLPKPVVPAAEGEVPEVIDGHNWKERYANLQRLRQKNLDEHKTAISNLNTQISGLQEQINNFVKKQAPASLPESDEDVAALREQNPAAYNAITRLAKQIADDIVQDKMKDLQSEVTAIRQGQKKNSKEANWIALQKRHPDIDLAALGEDSQFHIWVQSKSQRLQDAIYGEDMDVEAASEVLDLYKVAFPPASKSKAKKPVTNEDVPVKSRPAIPEKSAGWDFTESQIDEMARRDHRWFDANAEAIEKAQRSGRILMDISDPLGAARRAASEAA